MIVVLLQNAWNPRYAGKVWPREWWLEALIACRSGQRLKQILPATDDDIIDGDKFWVDNTTPVCGEFANSVVKPDLDHVFTMLTHKRPTLVVACGGQAQKVIDTFGTHGHFVPVSSHRYSRAFVPHDPVPKFSRIYMPHPAMRLMSNQCCAAVRSRIEFHLANQATDRNNTFHLKYSPRGEKASI